MPPCSRCGYRRSVKMPARGRASAPKSGETLEEVGPALRDATAIARRSESDEAEAAAARARLRRGPIPVIEPDPEIVPMLADGEHVHSARRHALLSRPNGHRARGTGGRLYLTSRRLVHLGKGVVSVLLTDIEEIALAGETLLLTLHGDEGISLDLDRPRLLRAEIAAVLRQLRR